jgi:hypothetical protein
MCAEAVVAQIAFCDSKTNLLLDFGVESSSMKRAAEIGVGFESCGCITEHAEEVGHKAKSGDHIVERLLRLAASACGIQGWNAIPVLRSAHLFMLSGETGATIQRNTLHAKRRWLPNSLEKGLLSVP